MEQKINIAEILKVAMDISYETYIYRRTKRENRTNVV